MGFRYSRRFRLAPGVRVNLSKSGVGYSIGRRGMWLTKRANGGRQATVGLPGSGLSYTARQHEQSTRTGTPMTKRTARMAHAATRLGTSRRLAARSQLATSALGLAVVATRTYLSGQSGTGRQADQRIKAQLRCCRCRPHLVLAARPVLDVARAHLQLRAALDRDRLRHPCTDRRSNQQPTQVRREHAAERRIRPGLGACAHSERPGDGRRYTNDCTHGGSARCHSTSSARGSDGSRATHSPGRASSHHSRRCTPAQNSATCCCTSSRYPHLCCSGEPLRSASEPIRLQLLRPWLQHLQPTSRHLQLLHMHSQL